MSKGAGIIERRLQEVFAREPDGVFVTATLCRRVYKVKAAKKKHRVAVLRALKRLATRSMPTLWRKVQKHERDDLWYDSRYFPGNAKDRAPAAAARPAKW
jgi:hypothetical protein